MAYHFPAVFQRGVTMRPSGVVEIHSIDEWKFYLDASIENNKLMVIEFTAMWCGPCNLMEQTMQEFAIQYPDVEFIKIDVDKLVFVARQFQVYVLPCFVLVKEGVEIDRVVGVKKNELQNKIEKHRQSLIWY